MIAKQWCFVRSRQKLASTNNSKTVEKTQVDFFLENIKHFMKLKLKIHIGTHLSKNIQNRQTQKNKKNFFQPVYTSTYENNQWWHKYFQIRIDELTKPQISSFTVIPICFISGMNKDENKSWTLGYLVQCERHWFQLRHFFLHKNWKGGNKTSYFVYWKSGQKYEGETIIWTEKQYYFI